jgi:hypothetical protein
MPRYALLLVLILTPGRAWPWGAPGHEVVAAIAEARLTPEARRFVRQLIGDESLSEPDIATWADGLRDRRTRPWHYVNIPISSGHYDPARDCARGCAVTAIERAEHELQGNDGARRRAADALRWLVHVVGDLHQPLHAGDAWDRGGNDLRVRLGARREPTNFHHVWDTEVVTSLVGHRGPLELARRLDQEISPAQVAAWTATLSAAAWAEESSRTARTLYAELGRGPGDESILSLPADYPRLQRSRVELALQRAGVRLAALLNRIASTRQGLTH